MSPARLALTALVIAFVSAAPTFGQAPVTPDLEEGAKPYASLHGGDIDQVLVTSGKLVLDSLVVSYPQRGCRSLLVASSS